jgi:2-polyprenyl-3-methyl-5-hydroxy-6-metoxy-1,4-benzoquinol methylase
MRFIRKIFEKWEQKPKQVLPKDSAEPRGPQAMAASVAFSCVLDQDPFLAAQCFIWLNCLLDIQSVPPEHVFIHHTGLGNADFAAWLASRRINLVQIKPYDPRSPHCNKLRQLRTFVREKFDRVVLMDCDTAWVGDAPLPPCASVAANIVHFANPPESILAAIFQESALGDPDWVPVFFPQGSGRKRTDRNNCNGGLYMLAGSVIPQLEAAWSKWADWCLERLHLFGKFAIHVDQVSFALALRELGISTDLLPIEWNFSVHVPAAKLPNVTPQIVHFHRKLGSDLKLQRVGVAQPDQALDLLNQRIEGFLARHFVNSMFWDIRYQVDPDLGSGVGSRGELLSAKRKWLGYALAAFEDKTVVDVGCGDLEVARSLPLKKYLGLDVSQRALALARAKRPDWRFAHITADQSSLGKGDVVICLDVLIHQKRASEFDALVDRLVSAAGQRLIVSGYNQPPQTTSAIVAFHRPIVTALKDTGVFHEISVIGNYRDCNLVVADKRRVGPALHPNDMPAADFNEASLLTGRPDLLRHLADLSRETFGFYTKQFSRAIEYPWIAEKLEALPPKRRVLDIGAGLNPIPIFLARRDVIVDCVDPHPMARVPPSQRNWNEWGYYDYARLHPNLRSHNIDALAFDPGSPLDAVYSVSVFEHLPRATWEAMLACCRRWLVKKGRLLLTIDLIPGTQNLWNYSEGREVEPPGVHGNITDFLNHLRAVGFTTSESFTRQSIPHSRTDLLFVDCVAR